MPDVYKDLHIEFIRDSDNITRVKFKDSEENYSEMELYMAYKLLHQTLQKLNFDWSIEGTIKSNVINKEEIKNGRN